ncbi:MAG: hypothetical protein WBP64_12220 [Nitrososphaeraceae archaeon]
MTKEGLAKVIGHAVIDDQFRKKLKENPEHTVYLADLSRAELDFLMEDGVLNGLEEFSKKHKITYGHGQQLGPNKSH